MLTVHKLSGHLDRVTVVNACFRSVSLFSLFSAGVVAIAYSNEYRFLLSAGSDHQVCVWSPFAEKQVYSLRGHTSPLIGVQFVPGTPQIVTADSDGWMKIWSVMMALEAHVRDAITRFLHIVLTHVIVSSPRVFAGMRATSPAVRHFTRFLTSPVSPHALNVTNASFSSVRITRCTYGSKKVVHS
jgi:WD40 repeat protein